MPTISTLTVDVNTRTSNFSRGLRLVTGGLTVLAAGAAYAFKQFEDAEKVMNQTTAVIDSTGGAAKVTAEHVTDLASSISHMTGIDDEAIQAGENLLLTFTNIRNEVGAGNDIFDQATQAITDMSVAMGTDLNSAAVQVGKALQDPILGMTALRRVGVSFTAAQTEMVNKWVESGQLLRAQKFILAELTKEFGGSAVAQKTASETMATSFGNLAEAVGTVLAPAITFLVEKITELSEWFTSLSPETQQLITLIGLGLAGAFLVAKAAAIALSLSNPFTAIALGVMALTALIIANWDEIKDFTLQVWDKIKGFVLPVFNAIKTVAMAWFTFFKIEFNVLKEIVTTVFDFIRNYVIPVFKGLIDGFAAVVNFVREHFVEPIVGAIQRVIEWIGNAASWIKDKFLGAWNAIKGPILAVLDAIIAGVQKLIGWIQTAIEWLARLKPGFDFGDIADSFPGGPPPNVAPGFQSPAGVAASAAASSAGVTIQAGVVVTDGQLANLVDRALHNKRTSHGGQLLLDS